MASGVKGKAAKDDRRGWIRLEEGEKPSGACEEVEECMTESR